MEDEIHSGHGGIHGGAVGHAALDEGMGKAVEIVAVAGAQVVEHDDFRGALMVLTEVAADEAGAARDEDAHGVRKKCRVSSEQ